MVFALTVLPRPPRDARRPDHRAGSGSSSTSPAPTADAATRRDAAQRRVPASGCCSRAGSTAPRELALELSRDDDPFVGCLVRLRPAPARALRGASRLTERVARAAPQLSDAFVLRGEHAAATGSDRGRSRRSPRRSRRASRVFARGTDAAARRPARARRRPPRAAVVRYVFQNHMRGSMWSVFTPRRFTPGTLLVTAADIGYEA